MQSRGRIERRVMQLEGKVSKRINQSHAKRDALLCKYTRNMLRTQYLMMLNVVMKIIWYVLENTRYNLRSKII